MPPIPENCALFFTLKSITEPMARDLLLELGIIKQLPDMSKLADTRFIK